MWATRSRRTPPPMTSQSWIWCSTSVDLPWRIDLGFLQWATGHFRSAVDGRWGKNGRQSPKLWIQEFTTQPAPPSFVPAFMSGLGSKMTLGEVSFYRLHNLFSVFPSHVFHVSKFSSSAASEHGCSNCRPCFYALLSKPYGHHHCTVSKNKF